ncbi:MAG: hypothetical protein HYY04_14915 [Chloroflexi bacterium]|nr:hypothetical protein [Chloroflexota bacterium]
MRQGSGIGDTGRQLRKTVARALVVFALTLTGGACQSAPVAGGSPPLAAGTAGDRRDASSASAAMRLLPAETIQQEGDLTFSADGFAPSETVTLQVVLREGDPPTEIWRAQVDDGGRLLDQELSLPTWLTSGERTLELVGETSGLRASATVAIRAKERWIEVSGYSVQVAQTLGFIAGGFEPGERVRGYLLSQPDVPPEATPVLTVETDRAGNTTWHEFEVPMVSAGPYRLVLVGATSGEQADRTITVEPLHPQLELEPWSGPPGATVRLTGRGFLAGEAIDIAVEGSDQPVATVSADEWGNFWSVGPVRIPHEAAGQKVTLTAIGQDSRTLVNVTFTVWDLHPWLELDRYAGYGGSFVQFSGGGFGAGEQVRVYQAGVSDTPVAVGVANPEGRFWNVGPAQVPVDAMSKVSFVVVGDQSGERATVSFEVLPLPTFGQGER